MPQQTISICEVLPFVPVLFSDKCSLASSLSRANDADVEGGRAASATVDAQFQIP
jgi:hypothetical protein